MASQFITDRISPALGDIRRLGRGDVIWIYASAERRHNWGGHIAAIADAIWKGAEVRRVWDE